MKPITSNQISFRTSGRSGMVLLALAMLTFVIFAGCKKESLSTIDETDNPQLPLGNMDAPSWCVDTNYDYNVSMTAVVKVDLTQTYPQTAGHWQVDPADRVAAFCEGECVGVAMPTGDLFFLFVIPPQSGGDGPVSLRYYSAKMRNVFYGNLSFPFLGGDRQGSISDPLQPLFRTLSDSQ